VSGGFDFDGLDQVFFAECEDYLRSAESVLRMENPASAGVDGLDDLRRCAHSIKGVSLTLGFTGLGALAAALDHCLAAMREEGELSDWSLLREGFTALRGNLAGLRDGAAKSLGGPPDLLRRLDLSRAVDVAPPRRITFRLSATGAATPVLFDDMLADLKRIAEVTVLQSPWDSPSRECQVESRPMSADHRALVEIIERVAEPGSVRIDDGGGRTVSSCGLIGEEALASPPLSRTTACVAFSLGARKFAADAPGVEEVRIGDTVHAAVAAPAWVCGTIERDGVFVPVIDLQQCLKLGSGRFRPSSMQLISRVAGETVAVLVDEVEDVLSVEPSAIQPFSRLIAGEQPGGMLGVLKRNGEALWVLDLPRVLEACIEADDAH
jgi:chemotaxis signal transduction protein/HPt (histidine-containing phosphotransfer) domain-containing protein